MREQKKTPSERTQQQRRKGEEKVANIRGGGKGHGNPDLAEKTCGTPSSTFKNKKVLRRGSKRPGAIDNTTRRHQKKVRWVRGAKKKKKRDVRGVDRITTYRTRKGGLRWGSQPDGWKKGHSSEEQLARRRYKGDSNQVTHQEVGGVH